MEFWGRFSFAQLPLKRFYKYVLKRIIGGFLLRDIDLEQLDVQLYRGIVQLQSLELDVEQFNAPLLGAGVLLNFVSGMIGCIKMDVPWRHLLRDHCKVYVAGLHLVLSAGAGSCPGSYRGASCPGRAGLGGPGAASDSSGHMGLQSGSRRPRYSEEGIETLSRLVKLVLSRMEVCILDTSVSLVAPLAASTLRARVASIIAFSEHEEGAAAAAASACGPESLSRAVRLAGLELLLEPSAAALAAAASVPVGGGDAGAPGRSEAAEGSPPLGGRPRDDCSEVVLASTCAPQDAPQDFVFIRRRGRRRDDADPASTVAEGIQLDVDVSVYALRIALAPAPWLRLSDLLACIGDIRAAPASAADTEGGEAWSLTEGGSASATHRSQPMVRSMIASSLQGGSGSTGFWHEFYDLFEADAVLEQAAGPETNELEEEEAMLGEDMPDVLGDRGAADDGDLAGPVLGFTVQAAIAHISALLVLEGRSGYPGDDSSALQALAPPRPTDVALVPGFASRTRQDHLQLSVEGWQLSASRSISPGVEEGGATAPLLSIQARAVTAHMHKREAQVFGHRSRRKPQRTDEHHEQAATHDEPQRASDQFQRKCSAQEFIIHSQREDDFAHPSASSTSMLNAAALARLGQSEVNPAMFASAMSQAWGETSAEPIPRIARTPSLSSCKCSTHESVGLQSEDSFLHSAVSSLRSLGDSSVGPKREEGEAASRRSGLDASASSSASAPGRASGLLFKSFMAPEEAEDAAARGNGPSAGGVRQAWQDDPRPLSASVGDEEEPDDGSEAESDRSEAIPREVEADRLEALFFDRSRSVREALLGDAAEGYASDPAAASGAANLCSTSWQQLVPTFRSKCILHLVSLPESAVPGHTDLETEPKDAPLSPYSHLWLPSREHPMWDCLRSFPGSRSYMPSVAGSQFFAEWRGDAATSAAPSVHVELQPVVVSLCSESLCSLASGVSWLSDGDRAAPSPKSGAAPQGSSQEQQDASERQPGGGDLTRYFGVVCVTPLVHLEVALPGTGQQQDLLVGSLLAPSLFVQPHHSCEEVVPPTDAFHETFRFELHDLALDLLSGGAPDRRKMRMLSMEAVASGATEGKATLSVFRFPGRNEHRDDELGVGSHEAASVVEQLPTEPPLAAERGADLWTKISVPGLESDSGHSSKSSLVLQDLRSASRRLLWQGGGRKAAAPPQSRGSSRGAERQPSAEAAGLGGGSSSAGGPARARQSSADLTGGEPCAEVVLSLPGTVQLQFDARTLASLQGAVSSLSESLGAPSPAPATSNSECDAIACTFELGCLKLSLLDLRSDAEHVEDCEQPAVACTEQLDLWFAPIQCRLVQSSTSTRFLRGLCQSLCLEISGEHCDLPEQLVRPWYRPIHQAACRPAAAVASTSSSPAQGWSVLREARQHTSLVPQGLLEADGERWREQHCVLFEVEQLSGCTEISASISRLACQLCLGRAIELQQRLANFLERAALVGRGGAAQQAAPSEPESARVKPAPGVGGILVKASILDCFVDIASDAYTKEWPTTAPVDVHKPTARPSDRGWDSDKWRSVLHINGLEVSSGSFHESETIGAQACVRDCSVLLVDHPYHLAQLDLVTDSQRAVPFLKSIGFAHILNLSGVKAAWQDGAGSSPTAQAQQVVEVSVQAVSGHVCADTIRCLLCAIMEVAETFSHSLQLDTSGMRATMERQVREQQKAAMQGHTERDSTTMTSVVSEGEKVASTSPIQGGILEGIDMFAFDTSQQTLARAKRPPTSPQAERGLLQSCLIDDYIQNRQLFQSPRSPVACAEPSDEHGQPVEIEMLELDSAEHARAGLAPLIGSASSVAVCLFDPEAYPQEKLQELCNEDEAAMAEVERLCAEQDTYSDDGAGIEGMPGSAPSSVSASHTQSVIHQDGSAAVWLVDPEALQVISDHFAQQDAHAPPAPAQSKKKGPAPPRTPPIRNLFTVRCEALDFSLCGGDDFEQVDAAQAQVLASSESAGSASRPSRRRQASYLALQLRHAEVKFMVFETMPFRRRLIANAREFGVVDHVQSSVFSHLVAYFEDEQRRPRPNEAHMFRLRVDEVAPTPLHTPADGASSGTDAPEYQVDLFLLPLRLTVDQDVVDFLLDFLQLCTLPCYLEEPQDFLLSASVLEGVADSSSGAGPSGPRRDESTEPSSQAAAATPALGSMFFQNFSIGPLLVSVDYRAKRLDVEALRRGDLWELINLLPLLEGLQIAFRPVSVNGVAGLSQVMAQVVTKWSSDMNRTQILRSLTGVTPIRSFANIGGGFVEMVMEPLKMYRTGSDSQRVSRTMLRGLVSFLRNVTVESIDLTERILVGAQSSLEYMTACIEEDQAASSSGSRAAAASAGASSARFRRPGSGEPSAAGRGGDLAASSAPAAEADPWTAVERGAADFLQPSDAAEGLQQACTSLTRGVRHAGEAVVVRPLLELQRGAPREKVLKSVVSGIPLCVLRPAIGATAAAATALRGVRNSVDPQHRREVEGKFKGPE
mmetsp:Transcript_177739/g.569845  ORF Transcript_177739/g.569845 Transcript_177739/m.569845 type:complete len:2489 (-) Transcript_177739:259-7725(-)